MLGQSNKGLARPAAVHPFAEMSGPLRKYPGDRQAPVQARAAALPKYRQGREHDK